MAIVGANLIGMELAGFLAGLGKRPFMLDMEAFNALDARRKALDAGSQALLAERKEVLARAIHDAGCRCVISCNQQARNR